MIRIRFALLIALLSVVSGCDRTERSVDYHLFAFGTLVELTFFDVSERRAQEAVQSVDEMYQRQHKDWHAWKQGKLMDLNQAIAEGRTITTDKAIIELIELGRHYEDLSRGLFNPAIGNLLKMWGFQQDDRPAGPPPSAQAVSRWLASSPSMRDVQVDGLQASSSNPDVRLDFGGFAKGFSVERAVQLLVKLGFRNFIVNAGGDLCARGRHGERPWRIGIRHPVQEGVLASIELDGPACVFTSGGYERLFEYQGKRYHHILDPRTGYPAAHTRSVTVVASDATLADAAATALFVAGPENWREIAVAMGVDSVLLLDEQNRAYLTPALAEQLQFEESPGAVKIVPLQESSGIERPTNPASSP